MSEPIPSNDPTPEERKSDSPFLPVVIAFAVAILVILIAAVVFIKTRQTKTLPPKEPHTTAQIVLPSSLETSNLEAEEGPAASGNEQRFPKMYSRGQCAET